MPASDATHPSGGFHVGGTAAAVFGWRDSLPADDAIFPGMRLSDPVSAMSSPLVLPFAMDHDEVLEPDLTALKNGVRFGGGAFKARLWESGSRGTVYATLHGDGALATVRLLDRRDGFPAYEILSASGLPAARPVFERHVSALHDGADIMDVALLTRVDPGLLPVPDAEAAIVHEAVVMLAAGHVQRDVAAVIESLRGMQDGYLNMSFGVQGTASLEEGAQLSMDVAMRDLYVNFDGWFLSDDGRSCGELPEAWEAMTDKAWFGGHEAAERAFGRLLGR